MSTDLDRRRLLASTAAVAAGAAVTATGIAAPAAAAPPARGAAARRRGQPAAPADTASITVTPGDPRYGELITGVNQRWTGTPGRIYVARSTDDVVAAVTETVRASRRLSIRSGGHCLAGLVFNPEVESVLDLSTFNGIGYDEGLNAFEVQPGVILLNAYQTLYKRWGVTIPGGFCYSVGAGGHVSGGGFGLLSRAHGLTVDHLYGVEVVVVDANGSVRVVTATRRADDPNRDLWWGYTGGGGGNFGVITRYWFRSPGATGSEPSRQLVNPPKEVLVSVVRVPWSALTADRFTALVRNVGTWYEANSAPDSPYTALSGSVSLNHVSAGAVTVLTQVDAAAPDARGLLDSYLASVLAGTGVDPAALPAPLHLPWLRATILLGTGSAIGNNPAIRSDNHSAYLLKGFTDDQISIIHRYLTSDRVSNHEAMVVLNPVGGRIGAVGPHDTAVAQRGAVLKALFQSLWTSPADDDANIAWATGLYREVYARTGNVPVPDDRTDGCYINYPDTAPLDDPKANTSGLSWHELYHKDNYPRLQQVKARWDPTDFFRHPLSVELPGR
ncbi:FAD-binding oxidoreductase [Candidatus Protofrankia californiensis]|uniref:FAD-binding oxidoreductase n=1 Tax=Candidatus Protofrankia californiensis TaxID=1839754 RepID=UPI001041B44B|nr:FAD-binding protein [Candidatus Protofrankia californiensis]